MLLERMILELVIREYVKIELLILELMSMTPVADDELHTHELFRTEAAKTFVGQEERLKKARDGALG